MASKSSMVVETVNKEMMGGDEGESMATESTCR